MAEKVKPEDERKMLDGNVYKTLVSRAEALKADAAEYQGEYAAFIKDSEQTYGAHRAVLQLMLRLRKMAQSSPAKLADWLRAFDHYRGLQGPDGKSIDDLAERDLFDEEGAASEPEPEPAPAPAFSGLSAEEALEAFSGTQHLAPVTEEALDEFDAAAPGREVEGEADTVEQFRAGLKRGPRLVPPAAAE